MRTAFLRHLREALLVLVLYKVQKKFGALPTNLRTMRKTTKGRPSRPCSDFASIALVKGHAARCYFRCNAM